MLTAKCSAVRSWPHDRATEKGSDPFFARGPMNPAKKGSDPFVRVAISLGSNLGDRRAHLDYAIDALQLDLTGIAISSFVETEAVGVGPEHGRYLNAAVVGDTQLPARLLLERLLDIEEERGRTRPYPMAPRTL